MQKADLTTRAVAGFVDLLLIVGLARLPDAFGFLSAAGYILFRDGLLNGQSIGKKLIGLRTVAADDTGMSIHYRESIIRNVPYAMAFFLFLIPYVGWVLGPLVLGVEVLTALGDNDGMRIGDMLARTRVLLLATAAEDARTGTGQQTQAPAESSRTEPHDSQL